MDYIDLKLQYEQAYNEHKQNVLSDLNLEILDGMADILPIQLLETRGVIEGFVVGCLLNNLDLYEDNKEVLQDKEFITVDGRLLFRIGSEIAKSGVKVIDELSISAFLNGKDSLKEVFNNMGGFSTIKDLKKVNSENFDAYLDDLQKYNIMNRLHFKGFNILDNFEKFKQMNSSELYDYNDYILSNTFLQTSSAVKPVDLTQGNDEYLKKANEGLEMGLDIDMKIMNYRMAGIHSGNILLHTAHSGVGKTSSIIPMYILPLIKRGNKVVLLINEQSGDAWRSMLLASIINNGFLGHDVYHNWVQRNRLSKGGFTDEEWIELNHASEWLKQFEGNLILYPLEDYSVATLKKIIKKMMRIDENTVFILDTWKPGDESSTNAHAVFTEESKDLFKIVKPKDMGGLGVHFIASAQLSGSTINQRYLNVNALAKAKAIKEVCGVILMHRNLWQDELDPNSKFYINPFRFNKETKKREEVTLDPEKNYVIQFWDKNRYGKADFQLLFEVNLDFNSWKEVCYCTSRQDYR